MVVVDTDPARMAGVQNRTASGGTAAGPQCVVRIPREGRHAGATGGLIEWLSANTELESNSTQDTIADPESVHSFERLRARALAGDFIFHSADIATIEGASVVNASLGRYPVTAMALPSDEAFLVQGAAPRRRYIARRVRPPVARGLRAVGRA